MKYAIVENSEIKNTGTITELFPNTIFSKGIPSQTFLNENNVVELIEKLPSTEPDQIVKKVTPYLGSDNKCYCVRLDASSETERQNFITNKWEELRQKRNALLEESDWRFISDNNLNSTDEWKDYRKALRDLTTQNSDPYLITFPSPPSV